MARRKIDLSTSGQGKVVDMKTGKPVEKPVLPVICERIQHYRDVMGMEQKALADLVGVTANSISNWENGRSRPDVNLLPAICNALNITLYDLFALNDPTIKYTARQQMLVDEFTALSEGHKKAVENLVDTLSQVEAAENCPELTVLTYFSRQLAAGFGDPTEFDDEGEDVYVYSSPDVDRADCIFTVNGNSMEPTYCDGDLVFVRHAASLQEGEIGIFVTGDTGYIKEYHRDGLYSHNPAYQPIIFSEGTEVRCIGRVIGKVSQDDWADDESIEKWKTANRKGR